MPVTVIAKIEPKNDAFTGLIDADQVIAGTAPITGTGILNAGSITSGFGNIDTGDSTITTTGTITGGNITSSGTLTFDEYTSGTIGITTIQDSGTAFNDNDTSLMTAGAIKDLVDTEVSSAGGGDITGVTIETDTGSGSKATDNDGSADFSIIGATGVGVTNSGTTITVTAVPGEIDHDSLNNFAANEHIDWTADQGGTNIHSGNYTNTTYSVGDGGLTTNDFTNDDHTKLNGIEAGATADQTKSDIDGLAITTVGTIDTGTWQGTTIAVDQGGTGATNSNAWLNSRITTNADGSLNYDATGATAVNHDSLTGFVANEHIDWTGSSAGTIHSSNYTNTTYSEATSSDEGLMSTAHHDKLDGIDSSADVTDATTVTSAGALMDSELTDLAGVKGVTISTLQVKPSEGAFANGDKTKLDAIDASADVTDATTVAAAGALMDSEVTNLADVKAFDTSDYATAAQGTLATNALPKAGGTMTGAITMGSGDKLQFVDANEFLSSDGTDLTIGSGGNVKINPAGGQVIIEDDDVAEPILEIKSTADSAGAGGLKFTKDRGSAGTDGDNIGIINWSAKSSDNTEHVYAQIWGVATETDASNEEGRIKLNVTTQSAFFGSASTTGLQLDGTTTNGQVDVIIGAGAASTTAVSGNLTVAGDVSGAALGIADNKLLAVDDADAADDDYAKFTANGLEGRSAAEVKTDLSLNNVSNDAQMPLTGGIFTGAVTLDGDPTNDLHVASKQYVDGKRFAVTTDQLNYRMGTVNYYYVANRSLGAAVASGDIGRYESPYAVYTAKDAVQVHSWTVYGSVSSSVSYQYELWDMTNSADGGSGNTAATKIGSTQSFNGVASRMYTVGETGLDYTLAAGHQLYVVKRYTSGSGNKYSYATVTVQLEVI